MLMMRTLLLLCTLFFPLFAWSQTSFSKVTDPSNSLAQQGPIPVYNGVSWMDYDNDGWEDCFVNSNNLYRNLQNGSFEKVPFSAINFGLGNGASWGDYDGDGDLDVIIAATPTRLYRNDRDSFALVPVTGPPNDTTFNFWAAAWGDYDEDGWLDLALQHPAGFLNPYPRPSIVLKNDQNGGFDYVDTPLDDEAAAHTIGSWTDYDLDGDLDLMVGSGEVFFLSVDHLFENQLNDTGSPSFERLGDGALATDMRDGQNWNFIDYDLDGDLDAFITNYNAEKPNDLYRNEGGTYVLQDSAIVGSIASQLGSGLNNVWADFDNDGYEDCFITFDGNEQDRYYHNNGDGTFTEIDQVFSVPDTTRGAAAGDYDNDGFLDLMISATTVKGGGLYHNEGNNNHWFHLRLAANGPNTAAIGAKVRIKARLGGLSKWQYREVNAQNAFNGHNSLRVHFGLRDAEVIDTLEVTWPDGTIQISTDVQPNQTCSWQQGGTNNCALVTNLPELAPASEQLWVFPNPVIQARELRFEYTIQGNGPIEWAVYDRAGQLQLAGSETNAICTDRLPAGIYALRVKRGDRSLTKHFTVVRL